MNARVLARAAVALVLLATLLVVALVGRLPGIGADAASPIRDFTITSRQVTGSAPLGPGTAPSPIDLAVTNPNDRPLHVTALGVTVTGTSRTGCTAADFTVRQYAGSYPLTVSARAHDVRLTSLGVPPAALPTVAMLDRPGDQDACKGATLQLSYTGSASR